MHNIRILFDDFLEADSVEDVAYASFVLSLYELYRIDIREKSVKEIEKILKKKAKLSQVEFDKLRDSITKYLKKDVSGLKISK